MSLADTLERAASALPEDADTIRPANGDPIQLLALLDGAAAVRVVSWLLANEPDAGVELALSWAEEEAGSAVLQDVDEAALPKPGKKALRKVLHRLRSRGLDVPRKTPEAPRVARLPEIEPEIEEGYISALDQRGGRLAYVLESNPAGGARLFEILLDENRGIIDFQVYGAARGRIRALLKQALDGSRFPTVEAPVSALRALVARIEALHPPDRVLPAAFVEHRGRLAVAGATPGDLAADALAVEGDAATEGLAQAVELVRKGAVGPWGPTAETLAGRVEGEVEAAGALPEGDEDWAALAGLVFCDEPSNAAARERLRESAFVFWQRGEEDEARACLAGAQAFAETAAPENPLAAAMVEVLLGPAVAAVRARVAEKGESTEGEGPNEAEADAGADE